MHIPPTSLDPVTQERSEGPTPHGGAYTVAYFRDANGDPCAKAQAAGIEIIEFDARDHALCRTYMQRPGASPKI